MLVSVRVHMCVYVCAHVHVFVCVCVFIGAYLFSCVHNAYASMHLATVKNAGGYASTTGLAMFMFFAMQTTCLDKLYCQSSL